jgi:uncharacterized protein
MPVDPFVVHVARLRRHPGTRWHEVRQGPFDPTGELDGTSAADSRVPSGADAVCDVVLDSYAGGIDVSGTVRAPWEGICGRCTAPVGGELVVPVRERFVPSTADGAPLADEEAYPIVDDELDLSPMVHDAIVLELPLAPLCRPDCRGLCPTCGADRNQRECGCVAPPDPRWASLDVLRPSSQR